MVRKSCTKNCAPSAIFEKLTQVINCTICRKFANLVTLICNKHVVFIALRTCFFSSSQVILFYLLILSFLHLT
jgi:hypothetical protein